MEKHYLLVDLNNEIHRCWHTTGYLSHNGEATGIAYGVLRDLAIWSNKLSSGDFVFCLDGGRPKRMDDYPTYKGTRNKRRASPEEMAIYKSLNEQANELAFKILPDLGYHKSIFLHQGYEADDLIASVINNNSGPDVSFTIISSDKDLYQLLAEDVCIFKPMTKEIYTQLDFFQEWGIKPSRWAKVKAIAGCETDDIVGVSGVGEKTAAKYLRGELPVHHKTHAAISEQSQEQFQQNLILTRLPYPGTPNCIIRPHKANKDKWRRTTEALGMESLKNSPPLFN